jgi:hypothetical protein
MNPRELADHIHSGPAKLVLDKPLRLRRRTRSNPCGFNEFIQALQSSETIRIVLCKSHEHLNIAESQWVLPVKALGCWVYQRYSAFGLLLQAQFSRLSSYPGCRGCCKQRSSTFCKQAVDQDLAANTFREHTTLQEFRWVDFGSPWDLSLILCSGHCQLVPISGEFLPGPNTLVATP